MDFRRKKHLQLNTSQIIALAFAAIILCGSLLLTLPFATKAPGSCGFVTALFTSTSAVCVTGLSLVDLYTTFTFFGQLVIMLLMQTGGLGFMSILAILFYMANRKYSVRSLSLMADSLGSDGIKNITRIQKELLLLALGAEFLGALILTLAFLPKMAAHRALWLGIFTSVSAFCNAGFDLFGLLEPGASLLPFQTSPVVLITVALLIIIGGTGFLVWDDMIAAKKPHFWSIYTRLVLITTGILIVFGTIAFYILEKDNPLTLQQLSPADQWVNAFFQSVTPRTAGFSSVNQADLSDVSISLTTLLMLIGGSAGSTAGGIKTVTVVILLKALWDNSLGRSHTVLMNRSISSNQVLHAFTVALGFIILGTAGGFLVAMCSGFSFSLALFESVSALATVGLSLGITPALDLASKLILIFLMYIGRVGLLTITLGFFHREENPNVKYPSVKIMIG